MAPVERGANFHKRTIGSEGFERFARSWPGIASTIFLVALGLGSVEGLIQAIDREMVKTATAYALQATAELGIAGALIYSRVRSRGKNREKN